MHIPCGCDARKEIMFQHGKPGRVELGVVAAAVLLLLLAWRANR